MGEIFADRRRGSWTRRSAERSVGRAAGRGCAASCAGAAPYDVFNFLNLLGIEIPQNGNDEGPIARLTVTHDLIAGTGFLWRPWSSPWPTPSAPSG